jgi:hypothetical protein
MNSPKSGSDGRDDHSVMSGLLSWAAELPAASINNLPNVDSHGDGTASLPRPAPKQCGDGATPLEKSFSSIPSVSSMFPPHPGNHRHQHHLIWSGASMPPPGRQRRHQRRFRRPARNMPPACLQEINPADMPIMVVSRFRTRFSHRNEHYAKYPDPQLPPCPAPEVTPFLRKNTVRVSAESGNSGKPRSAQPGAFRHSERNVNCPEEPSKAPNLLHHDAKGQLTSAKAFQSLNFPIKTATPFAGDLGRVIDGVQTKSSARFLTTQGQQALSAHPQAARANMSRWPSWSRPHQRSEAHDARRRVDADGL